MPTRPCSFRFLSPSRQRPAGADPGARRSRRARDAPGDLLSAAPYRAPWAPSRAAQAYKLHYRTPGSPRRAGRRHRPAANLPAGTPPIGGWPVVSWAHGTQGIADRCAPSVSGPTPCRTRRALPGRVPGQGYAVAAADYHGLGSPGRHACLHVRTAARNTIDMVKASRQYLGAAALSPRWVSVGYSQGAAAALVAATWRLPHGGPSLQYRGSFTAGTPTAVELTALVMKPDNRTCQSRRAQRVSRVSARRPVAGRAAGRPGTERRRARPHCPGTRAVPG